MLFAFSSCLVWFAFPQDRHAEFRYHVIHLIVIDMSTRLHENPLLSSINFLILCIGWTMKVRMTIRTCHGNAGSPRLLDSEVIFSWNSKQGFGLSVAGFYIRALRLSLSCRWRRLPLGPAAASVSEKRCVRDAPSLETVSSDRCHRSLGAFEEQERVIDSAGESSVQWARPPRHEISTQKPQWLFVLTLRTNQRPFRFTFLDYKRRAKYMSSWGLPQFPTAFDGWDLFHLNVLLRHVGRCTLARELRLGATQAAGRLEMAGWEGSHQMFCLSMLYVYFGFSNCKIGVFWMVCSEDHKVDVIRTPMTGDVAQAGFFA